MTRDTKHWSAARWCAVILTLSAAPVVFHFWLPTATASQGFALGWCAAAIVLLARR